MIQLRLKLKDVRFLEGTGTVRYQYTVLIPYSFYVDQVHALQLNAEPSYALVIEN